jgi:hypothetical protein
MSGGRGILTRTSTAAIVCRGTTITNAEMIVPKSNFFILLPPSVLAGANGGEILRGRHLAGQNQYE